MLPTLLLPPFRIVIDALLSSVRGCMNALLEGRGVKWIKPTELLRNNNVLYGNASCCLRSSGDDLESGLFFMVWKKHLTKNEIKKNQRSVVSEEIGGNCVLECKMLTTWSNNLHSHLLIRMKEADRGKSSGSLGVDAILLYNITPYKRSAWQKNGTNCCFEYAALDFEQLNRRKYSGISQEKKISYSISIKVEQIFL